MAEWDRNQPVGSSQELEFDQPVVNIGSHPENDAVISGAGVLPFHAMLMVEEQNFRLVSLAPDANILVDGAPLAEQTIALKDDQRLDIGQYSLVVKHNGTPTSLHLILSETDAAPVATVPFGADHENSILLNVLSRQAEVEVEHAQSISSRL
jgi:predicted component of type VI protein secretion system